MKPISRLLTLLSGTAILCLTPRVQATPISAYLGASSSVNFYDEAGGLTVAQDNQAWTGIPGALSVNTMATGISTNGSTTTTFNRGQGTWAADGNSGTVTIDFGWSANTHDVVTAVGTGSVDPQYGLNWSYTFVADQTGLFVIDCKVVGSGSTSDPGVPYPMFGLMGFDTIGTAFFPLGANFYDPTASGQVTQMLQAGNTYTMVIRNGGNVSGSLGEREAAVHAEFSWSLPGATPAVPDSASTLALLGLGLGGLGLAGRRVRRVQTA